MEVPVCLIPARPEGEGKTSPPIPSGAWPVDTPGGRFFAEWDDQAPVTREGQLIFFQFLHTGGRWEELLRGCLLHDTGNRGCGARHVMGTVLLSLLYGHQQGAKIGDNPQNPGRPSHVFHSDFVAHLRLSLGVEVLPGNEHAAAKGLPGLWQTLAKLPRHQWPTFTRGDSGYTAARPPCWSTKNAAGPPSSNSATPPKSKTSSSA